MNTYNVIYLIFLQFKMCTLSFQAKKGFDRLNDAAQGHGKNSTIINEEIAKKYRRLHKVIYQRSVVAPQYSAGTTSTSKFSVVTPDVQGYDLNGKWSQTGNGESRLIFDEMYGDGIILIFSLHFKTCIYFHCLRCGMVMVRSMLLFHYSASYTLYIANIQAAFFHMCFACSLRSHEIHMKICFWPYEIRSNISCLVSSHVLGFSAWTLKHLFTCLPRLYFLVSCLRAASFTFYGQI